MKRQLIPALVACFLIQGGIARAEPAELVQLRKAYQEEVAASDAPIAGLNQKFVEALQRLQEERAQTGNLESVLVVKKELEWIGESREISPRELADRISEDSGLAGLQRTYLRAREKLDADLAGSREKLALAYRARLAALEENLTRQQRIEEAILVKTERESLPEVEAALPLGEEMPVKTFKGRLHFVGKGEIEVYLNGKKTRYRNETKERGYVDGETAPLDISVGDVVAIRIRSEAVFRGVIFGIESTDGTLHGQFPASSFRLIDVGEELDSEKISSAEFIGQLKAQVTKSQPDPTMNSLWGPHGIKHCQYIQPPGKGQWAIFGTIVTEDRLALQEP